jgi:hypothetical protein
MGLSETRMRLSAFLELLRYDLMNTLFGFSAVYDSIGRVPAKARSGSSPTFHESQLCEAVSVGAMFYWKRIRCLQRAVVTARLMRRHGIQAQMVIGYRSAPFFAHAWVEVDGRVVNDSRAYGRKLCKLARI